MANDEANSTDLESVQDLLADDSAKDRLVSHTEYWQTHQERSVDGSALFSGLGLLDSFLGGFQKGELVTITGPTGNGKTLLADSIGQRLMRFQKTNIAWFSYEVPTIQFVQKYVNAEDTDKLGLKVPLLLKAGDFSWLQKKCIEAKLKFECDAVFIDHLHFIVDMNEKTNMSLNIGAVMRRLKQEVAVRLDMVVFVLAHQGQPKREDEPGIDNIRDSSFIGQESDSVLVVYRTADPVPPELEKNAQIKGYPRTFEEGYCTVKVEKARRTGVYKKRISFQKQGYWLEEV